jgi:hypothetical protein
MNEPTNTQSHDATRHYPAIGKAARSASSCLIPIPTSGEITIGINEKVIGIAGTVIDPDHSGSTTDPVAFLPVDDVATLRKPRWAAYLLLLALCPLLLALSAPQARAQGQARIPVVATVPATCSTSGTNSPVMVWKRTSPNPGLYLCIAGLFQYQTNTFGSGLTAKTMIYASATPVAITSTAAPTDGQLLIGDTSDVPALGTLTSTANETLITNAAHSITIGLAATLNHKVGTSFNFQDPSDITKAFQFVASGITTATTRTITVPDSNIVLPIATQQLTFAGPTAARTITFPDAAITVARTDAANTFTGNQTFVNNLVMNGSTSGSLTIVAPAIAGSNTLTLPAGTTNFTATGGAGQVVKQSTVGAALTVAALVPTDVHTIADTLLSSTAAVDMNSAVATTLYTCPTGKSCVITSVVVRNASTSLTTASYSFGWTTAAFADVIANAAHTELVDATVYTKIQPKTGATLGTSTGTFKVLMNTLQGGAATTTIDVFGYVF